MRKFNITVDGQVYEVEVEELAGGASSAPKAAPKAAAPKPAPAPVAAPAPAPKPASAAAGDAAILSPLPGTVLRVNVSAGQSVKAGEVLMVLEAMKMENDIVAPEDGVVSAVNVKQGDTVQSGDLLCSL